MIRRWPALLLLALLAGCSSASGTGGTPPAFDQGPSHATLVADARLAPCPASAGSGGGLPHVTLPCLGRGPAVDLAGLTGRPTVVNVWGSWCTECRAESGYLSSVYDKVRSRVRFLGVDTVDSADSALDYATHVSPPMHYPSVIDPDKQVLLGLHLAPGPPETAFLDAGGRVVHVTPGAYTSARQLEHDITTYLHVAA